MGLQKVDMGFDEEVVWKCVTAIRLRVSADCACRVRIHLTARFISRGKVQYVVRPPADNGRGPLRTRHTSFEAVVQEHGQLKCGEH